MKNQLSSTPKRMLGCVILGLFGFLFLCWGVGATGTILGSRVLSGLIFGLTIMARLCIHCFE